MNKKTSVPIPAITSLKTAVFLYHEKDELGNKEIRVLFGPLSNSKISELKKEVLKEMAIENKMNRQAHAVNTEIAYKVWGLDIEDMEKRLAKIQKLNKLMA